MTESLTRPAVAWAATSQQGWTGDLQGDQITVETLVATAEMARIADAIDAAVDSKDWALARSFFTDDVTVLFTIASDQPATIPADDLIGAWSGNLTTEKTSFHLRGNHRVAFEGADAATMLSHGYAWNRLERGALKDNGGDPLWEVWGVYEHRFERTAGGWKVNSLSFYATAERGNEFVRNTPGTAPHLRTGS